MNERKILAEVIKLFEQHRCLWDANSENYRHNAAKNTAWKAILKKYKEIDPDACTIDVKNKIANMRSGYRREWRKMQTYGPTSTELYRPHLWYFNLLSFLKEHPNPDGQQDINSGDPLCGDSEEEPMHEIDIAEANIKVEYLPEPEDPLPLLKSKKEIILQTEVETPQKMRRTTIKKHKIREDSPVIIESEPKKLKYNEGQSETYVAPIKVNPFTLYIDQQLDSVTKYQRQIAEKLISDVIFLAKTGNLTMESKIETYKAQAKVETVTSGTSQTIEDAESTESGSGKSLREILLYEDTS